MRNTLEGINRRINEAEEWISELEDRMEEITDTEQNKDKRMERNEDSLRNLWSNAPTFASQGSQKEMRERKGLKKYLNTLLSWERKQSPKSRKHAESHTGLTQGGTC